MTEPGWLAASRATFDERLKLLALACMHALGRTPIVLAISDGIREAVRCDPEFVRREPPDPEALEVARHAAAAWRAWTRGLDPLDSGVFLSVEVDQARVLIAPLSTESILMFRSRAAEMREHLRQEGIDAEPIAAETTRRPEGAD